MELTDRHDFILRTIAKWAEQLRVQDWDVRYLSEQPGENCQADNHMWGLKKVAVMRIIPDMEDRTAIERVIVHELLHIVLRSLEMVSKNGVRFLGTQMKEDYESDIDDEIEVAIEHLTTALTGEHYVAPPGCNDIYLRAFGEPKRARWAQEAN